MESAEIQLEETDAQLAGAELQREPSREEAPGKQEPSTEDVEVQGEQTSAAELEHNFSIERAESQQEQLAEDPELPQQSSIDQAQLQLEETAAQQE
jgi:hypothetical protein